MTIKSIHLNKLLKLLAMSDRGLTSMLRDDLRQERKKLDAEIDGGGDFHAPFWRDAKDHVLGKSDLTEQTEIRIASHGARKRLYPLLATGFLSWIDFLKRGTNAEIGWSNEHAHNHYPMPGFDLIIKVDSILGLNIGDRNRRLIYPYFSESPILNERWARVGLWLMSDALPEYSVTDFEILDVLRGKGYSGSSLFFKGDEESIFCDRYKNILSEWLELRPEYGLK
jgi:hypothetical protein